MPPHTASLAPDSLLATPAQAADRAVSRSIAGYHGMIFLFNLPLLFAVGIAIGMAKKADGSTALAAVVGAILGSALWKTDAQIVVHGGEKEIYDQGFGGTNRRRRVS